MTSRERAAGLYTIAISQFALAFMLSAVAVAVPALGREFGAGASELGLVESGYIAAVAAVLFPVTRLSDKIGRGFTFALGVGLFTAFSFVLPLAETMQQFILLRILQGCGGAMLVATGLAIIADIYPGKGRAKAMGIASAGVYLGLSAGPWLGGMIVTHFGWRWIFFAGATPCALGFFLTLKTLPVRPVIVHGVRFDWVGAILGAIGMILLSLGGSHLHDTVGVLQLAGSAVALTGFVLWERRAKAPLLEMALFSGNPSFSLGSAVQFISYAATFGITFLLSLYLQAVLGMTAGQAGLVLLAQPVTMVVFSLAGGSLCERWPPHLVATLGMGLATVSLGGAVFLDGQQSLVLIVASLGLCGAGCALFATANMAIIMGAVQSRHYGVASAVVASMRTMGMTVSLVLISGIMALVMGPVALNAESASDYVTAMRLSFVLLTVLSGVGVVMSARARIRKRKESGGALRFDNEQGAGAGEDTLEPVPVRSMEKDSPRR